MATRGFSCCSGGGHAGVTAIAPVWQQLYQVAGLIVALLLYAATETRNRQSPSLSAAQTR